MRKIDKNFLFPHMDTQKTYLFSSPKVRTRSVPLAALAALILVLAGCAGSGPRLAQTRQALDPAGFPQAVSGPGFTLSAVAYEPGDDGFDYRGAGFSPVLLVLKSSDGEQPQIIVEDVRAVTQSGQYLPYTPAEAARLAANDLAFSEEAKTAFKDGFVGAVIGGGLGALAGLALGKDPNSVWMGAAVGAAAGGAYGAISSRPQSRTDLARAVSADLEAQAWREDPLAPETTRVGYVYLPSQPSATSLRLLVRGSQAGDIWVSLAIVSPRDYAQPAVATAGRPAGASDLPRPKPAPEVGNAPGWTPQADAQAAPIPGSSPGSTAGTAPARSDQPAQAGVAASSGADTVQNDGSGDGQAATATRSDQEEEHAATVAEEGQGDEQTMAEEDEAPAEAARKAPQRVSRETGRKGTGKSGRSAPGRRTPDRPAPIVPAPEGVTI